MRWKPLLNDVQDLTALVTELDPLQACVAHTS